MPYYSRCNALYGALLRYEYEEYTPLILCPLCGVLLRCGRYALQAVPMRGAFGSPSSRPALLSLGCSLLTGARGAFNRVIFLRFGGTVKGAKCY